VRQLILAGGIFHDFNSTSEALTGVLDDYGFATRIEEDIEHGLASLERSPVDLLTINALRWEMQGQKYDPYRDEWAMQLSLAGQQAIENHLARGGALLALHTASICFSNWRGWRNILGGAWSWGESWHPAPEPVSVTPTSHALVADIPPFLVTDELYSNLEMLDGNEVLSYGTSESQLSKQPLMWLREHGGGRIVYDSLGHDCSSVEQTEHAEILRRAVKWALQK